MGEFGPQAFTATLALVGVVILIAALLSDGLPPLDAASLGAFVHGVAGRLAASGAPTTADAVALQIPRAIAALTRP